jgi:hypothetical protein
MFLGMGRYHQDLKIAAPYCTGPGWNMWCWIRFFIILILEFLDPKSPLATHSKCLPLVYLFIYLFCWRLALALATSLFPLSKLSHWLSDLQQNLVIALTNLNMSVHYPLLVPFSYSLTVLLFLVSTSGRQNVQLIARAPLSAFRWVEGDIRQCWHYKEAALAAIL